MSCIAYPEIIDPRRSFQEYTVASGNISRFTTEFVLRKVVALFKSHKPAAWRLELRVAKFLCCFHCKLLDNRTIDWSALFGFLLEPFPYSIIHVRVLWSTVTLLRTGKSSFVLLSYKSLLFQNVTYVCFSTTKFLTKFAYSCQSFAIFVFFYDLKTFF